MFTPASNKNAPKLTPEQRDEVARLYISGRSMGSLAMEFEVDIKSIKGILLARKVEIRPLPPKKPKVPKKIHQYNFTTMRHDEKALRAVERAIRKKILIRPEHCVECGQAKKKRNGLSDINAHHDDYNKPLDVRWLCSQCHFDWHCNNQAIERIKDEED